MINVKFRKKPIIIEAFRMTKERRLNNFEWPKWLHAAWNKKVDEDGAMFCSNDGCIEGEKYTSLFIQTLEGTHKVEWNDWIIKGVNSELYPCKPDIFEKTYEEVK